MSSQDEIKNIQNILDDHKQSMPDEVYKQICSATMKAFNKKSRNNNNKYYKVKYIYTHTQFATKVITNDTNEAQYKLDTKVHSGELIIKINNNSLDSNYDYDSDSDSYRLRNLRDGELRAKFVEMIKKNNIIFTSEYSLQHSEEVSDISLLINNEVHIISYKLLNKY